MGVNYEEVLVQGDSVLGRDSESSSYPGFGLSRFNSIANFREAIKDSLKGRPKNGMFIAVANEIKEDASDVSSKHWPSF